MLSERELKKTLELYEFYGSYNKVAREIGISVFAVKQRLKKVIVLKDNPSVFFKEPTLCWSCKKSVGKNMCCWAKSFTPVPGWTAKETKIRMTYGFGNSYHVEKCPLYVNDYEVKNES